MPEALDTDPAALNALPGDDLSALAWVHGELRRSLEGAHKALRRHLKDADAVSGGDLDAVDPSVLRGARTQLHQGVGALELVGMPQLAEVLRASESAVQRLMTKPSLVTAAAVDTIEKVSFALLDYLARHLAHKPVTPLMLFPQYRTALALAGADRVHPADLWPLAWQWRSLPVDPSAQPRAADDEARSALESLVLGLMREPGQPLLARLSDLCAQLGAGARAGSPQLATLWQLASAVFEAQAAGLLQPDVFTKRLASRLLSQLRGSIKGQAEASDRLAQDLLFFCGRAAEPTQLQPAPRLAAVRQAWALHEHPVVDYETSRLGRFDPAHLVQARKRVAAAKDGWSAVAGGELHRISGLAEQFALVGESLQKLFPAGEVLAQSLQAAAGQVVARGDAPSPALAMEVATGILYLDASLEDGELEQPELAQRVQRLAARVDSVRQGAAPQPLDAWMEELYRRVSDRQTMGSVVAELRASLSEVEKHIDQYFRIPAERQVLIPVPAQLQSMRGVLSVLGLDQASQAALHMRDSVDELAQTEVDPQRAIQTGTFDRLADNLGALSFLIDMLSVQPQLAKSLFRFNPATGVLSAVMGKTERSSSFALLDEATPAAPSADATVAQLPLATRLQAFAASAALPEVSDADLARGAERLAQQALTADQPELARLLQTAQRALREATGADTRRAVRAELVASLPALLSGAVPEAAPPPAPVPPPRPAPQGGTGLEDDAEMREIFIDEAREVVEGALAALQRLQDAPDSSQDLTAVRRAFHTLKGSSRMVGLRDFGDAAWSCEQLYNARLAAAPHLDAPLRQVTEEALAYLSDWVEAIAQARAAGHRAADVSRVADALRLDDKLLPLPLPQPEAPTLAMPAPAEAEPLPDWALLDRPAATEPAEPAEAEPKATIVMPVAALAEPLALAPDAGPVLDSAGLGPVADATVRVPSADRTIVLPSAPPAEPAAASAPLEPEFTLSLDGLDGLDLTDPETAAPAMPVLPLSERLPGLPSEADLDLDLPAPAPAVEALEIDLADLDAFESQASPLAAAPSPVAEPMALLAQPVESLPEPEAAVPEAVEPDEQVKIIGPLRIGIPLFNIYLNEADELSRRLVTELAEWALEWERHPVSDTSVALAHSLAGSSATVGYADLSALARSLEHALMRSAAVGHGRAGEAPLFSAAADEVRRLLHQFAAGFLRTVDPAVLQQLSEHERWPVPADTSEAVDAADDAVDVAELPLPAVDIDFDLEAPAAAPAPYPAPEPEDDIDAVDAVDAELFPIFEEEADELLPQLTARLREWHAHPGNAGAPAACMRTLHTFKGGARLAGAMRLGEMAHRLETAVEQLSQRDAADAASIDRLIARADGMAHAFDLLRRRGPVPIALPDAPPAVHPAPAPVVATLAALPVLEPLPPLADSMAEPSRPPAEVEARAAEPGDADIDLPFAAAGPSAGTAIDWSRFAQVQPAAAPGAADRVVPGGAAAAGAAGAAVRVRAGLLDRLVNNAGEVSITRSRIDSTVNQLQGSLGDLTESLERLRRQLRDIELQAETQISSRLEAAKAQSQSFDPLEMDRFTRFQELTRFMAESVNDVATLQRSLQRTLQTTEDELAAQARLTRELQEDLLRTRMVEFESLADRLYRTVRQAGKDTAKQVRLDIVGGGIEIDRGVLERMVGSFEHLLRNCVAHGVESPLERERVGKEAAGLISVTVTQAGNEVSVEVADDGAGLNFARIRSRAVERGLLAADAPASDDELAQLIFAPGFSTADSVTELAGRGVGLDVVRAEVNAMGGRIETHSEALRGTRFRLLLPLTTAVTQVVMLRCSELQVAVPSPLIEVVRRVPTAEVEQAYADGWLRFAGEQVPFHWLAALLQQGARGPLAGRSQNVVIVRSASQRVAVHVDEVVGNQEVVVKNVGPQLSRLPGLAGVTLLPSGAVALIYNPVALAAVYGSGLQERVAPAAHDAPAVPVLPTPQGAALAPLVLVVDDSLTVRRVTQRLLTRAGYRVSTAKDGLDALERLAEERPAVLLSDIEMPRMDGFDLVRNVRADARLAGLPVIMITSRIAQKHRDYATELGVDHYLGKPYGEEELLGLVAGYTHAQRAVPSVVGDNA